MKPDLEAVSGGTQEGLEQEAAIRGAPGPGGTLALLRDVLYEEGYCALTLAGELLAPGGHSSAFCGADPLSTCWVCRAWDLVSSEQPARPAPPSPDSPSQGERKRIEDLERALRAAHSVMVRVQEGVHNHGWPVSMAYEMRLVEASLTQIGGAKSHSAECGGQPAGSGCICGVGFA